MPINQKENLDCDNFACSRSGDCDPLRGPRTLPNRRRVAPRAPRPPPQTPCIFMQATAMTPLPVEPRGAGHATVSASILRKATAMIPLLLYTTAAAEEKKDEQDVRLIINKNKSIRESIVKTAYCYLNTPYLWGGKSPFGIDCSGFTQMVYKIKFF